MHRNTRGHLGDCSARRGRQAAKRWGRRHLPALLHELPWLRISAPPILASQDAVPAAGSVLDMLLRAINKETGHGLTDVQIASQANTLIAGAAAAPGTPACMHPLAGQGSKGQGSLDVTECRVRCFTWPFHPLFSTPRPLAPANDPPLSAAGYETSANALAFAVYCLATHPEAEARLVAEINACGAQVRRTGGLACGAFGRCCCDAAVVA